VDLLVYDSLVSSLSEKRGAPTERVIQPTAGDGADALLVPDERQGDDYPCCRARAESGDALVLDNVVRGLSAEPTTNDSISFCVKAQLL
jgi:hypothetical protein